jgi:hypothetical protein
MGILPITQGIALLVILHAILLSKEWQEPFWSE